MVVERRIRTCPDFLRKVLNSVLRGRYNVEKDIGYCRYPGSETENVSPPWIFVYTGIFLLCSWNQRLVFEFSLPNDGSWAFQVTSYLLSEWKYLNACCFSSFKLFPPYVSPARKQGCHMYTVTWLAKHEVHIWCWIYLMVWYCWQLDLCWICFDNFGREVSL